MATRENNVFSKKITLFSIIYSLEIVYFHCNLSNWGEKGLPKPQGILEQTTFFVDNYVTVAVSFALTYFFFVSAYLLFYNLKWKNMLSKLWRRVKSLVLPLIIWNLVGYLIINCVLDRNPLNISEVIVGIYKGSFCGGTWFVGTLLTYLLLIVPIYVIMQIPVLSEIVVLFLFVQINYGIFDIPILRQSLGMFTLDAHFVAYMFGAYLALRWKQLLQCEQYKLGIKIIAAVMWLFSVLISIYEIDLIINPILLLLHPLMVWIMIPNKLVEKDLRKYNFSFMLFLLNMMVLKMISLFLTKFGILDRIVDFSQNKWANCLLVRFCMGTVIIAIIVGVFAVIRKRIPKVYNVIAGGRL